METKDFVKEKVGYDTFMIATDNKHYNLFLVEEHLRDAQQYKIRKQSKTMLQHNIYKIVDEIYNITYLRHGHHPSRRNNLRSPSHFGAVFCH